jgi:hypothetical protein
MKKYILILIMSVMTLNVSAKNFSLNAGYNVGSSLEIDDAEGDVDSSFSVGGKYHVKVNDDFSWGPVIDYKFDSKLEGSSSTNISSLFYGIFSNYKFNNGVYINASVGFNSPDVDTAELNEATELLLALNYGGTWDVSYDFRSGFSYIVGIGYEINKEFSIEANFKSLGGKLDVSASDGTRSDSGTLDYSLNTITIGAVAKF